MGRYLLQKSLVLMGLVAMLACSSGTSNKTPSTDSSTTISNDTGDSNQPSDVSNTPNVTPPAVVSVCGNGAMETGEQCDDGNAVSGDGCSSACKTENCGDGIVQTSL